MEKPQKSSWEWSHTHSAGKEPVVSGAEERALDWLRGSCFLVNTLKHEGSVKSMTLPSPSPSPTSPTCNDGFPIG